MKNRVLTRQPSAHGRTGDVLDEEQAQAAREEDVFSSLSDIGVRFRTRIANSRQPSKSDRRRQRRKCLLTVSPETCWQYSVRAVDHSEVDPKRPSRKCPPDRSWYVAIRQFDGKRAKRGWRGSCICFSKIG